MPTPAPIRHAIRELAERNASLRVATSITERDAAEYVTDDVLIGYWTEQRATGGDADAWLELYTGLSDSAHAQLIGALANAHPAALRTLRETMVSQVARWLAAEAEAYQTEHGLGGEDFTPHDDPVAADRRAIARDFGAAARAVS